MAKTVHKWIRVRERTHRQLKGLASARGQSLASLLAEMAEGAIEMVTPARRGSRPARRDANQEGG